MKAIIGEYSCSVRPTDEDTHTECKIGQGADTCIFITMSGQGWECVRLHWQQNLQLTARADAGTMMSQKRGCDRVNNFHPLGMEVGTEVDIP